MSTNTIQNLGRIAQSNSYHNQQLNATTTNINYSTSLQGYTKYNFQLALPVGCDFTLLLYNSSNAIVASSLSPMTGPGNRSFIYRNTNPTSLFTIQVNRTSGDGAFNLTFSLIPNTFIPQLTNYTVIPGIGTHLVSFNFSTRYIDLYGNAPVFIDVEIGGMKHALSWNAQTGNNYTTGVVYCTNLTFPVGYYTFNFTAGNGWYNSTPTPNYHFTVIDMQPQLINFGVNLTIGPKRASYNFSAKYVDVYNRAPAYINVIIDGNAKHLLQNNQTGNNYTRGVVFFTIISNFTDAYHSYYFTAGDGWLSALNTATNYVNVTDNLPRLSNIGVVPAIGTTSMSYNFSTKYSDVYDRAPTFINVVINGTAHQLTRNGQTGTNYSRGVVYYTTISSFTIGNYTYNFTTSDGWNTTTTSSNILYVRTPPQLSSFGVNCTLGTDFEWYNFSVKYSSTYGKAPLFIDVVINGTTKSLPIQTSINYTRGVVYYTVIKNFTVGYYPFYFKASDGWLNATTSTFHVNVTDTQPRLSNYAVNCTIGPPSPIAFYNFSVSYRNVYGRAPTFINVTINGKGNHLFRNNQTGSNYTRGVVYYTIIRNFTTGYYLYSFTAGDGWYTNTTLTYHVNVTISHPRLINSNVYPSTSPLFTPFNFSVRYSDTYGDAPAFINVVINGNTNHLTRNTQTGNNYTRGAVFYTIISNFTLGYYPFYFTAGDGWYTNTTSTFHVNVTKPVSWAVTPTHLYIQSFKPNYNNVASGKWTNTTTPQSPNHWIISTTQYHSSPSSIGIQGGGTFPNYENGVLISPLFDLTGNFQYELTFDISLLITPTCYIETQVNMSGTWGNQIFLTPNLNGAWQQVQQNLSQYKGSYVQFRITFTGFTGTYLYLDDFSVQTSGNANILYAAITPYQGNQYDASHLEIEYQDSHNILPNSLYLSIWNGTIPNAMQINFTQDNSSDLIDSDGKYYHCDFQAFDIANPVLWCDSDHGSWCLSIFPYFVVIDRSVPLEIASFPPYNLNFDNASGTYYTMNNYQLGTTGIVSSATNHYFQAVSTATSGEEMGLATPLIPMNSDVLVHMTFYAQAVAYNTVFGVLPIALTGYTFTVYISTNNGISWTNLKRYTSNFTANVMLDLTSKENQTVCIRFLLATSGTPITQARLIVDNISIYEVDTTPPTMSSNIKTGQQLQGTVLVNMTVHDIGFGVGEVMVFLDGQSIANVTSFKDNVATATLDTTKFSNGNHNLTIIVIDKSGNQQTYMIAVKIDNTPYLLIGILIVVIAAAVIIGVIAIKKNTRRLRNIPKYLNKRVILKQIKPSKEIAEKILQITSIVRRIKASELARKLQLPNVTQSNVLGYLRFMLAENMIHGNLDESTETFMRTFPEKMKVTLKEKEGAILDYLARNDRVKVGDVINDLQLENMTREALEDFILGLVTARRINCYFDGDTIIKESGPIEQPPAAKSIKTRSSIADKEGAILEYLSTRQRASFDDLTSDLRLGEFDREAIEDFLISLVSGGKLKCHLEGDTIINEASSIKNLRPTMSISEPRISGSKPSKKSMPRKQQEAPAIKAVPEGSVKIKPIPSTITEDITTPESMTNPPKIIVSGEAAKSIKKAPVAKPSTKETIQDDKESDILEYLSTKENVSFDELIKNVQLDSFDHETIEDFIVSLVNSGKLKCHFDGDTIVNEAVPSEASMLAMQISEQAEPATSEPRQVESIVARVAIDDKKDELINLVTNREKISFDEIKDALDLEESVDEIEDFLFALIKNGEIKGIIDENSFLST